MEKKQYYTTAHAARALGIGYQRLLYALRKRYPSEEHGRTRVVTLQQAQNALNEIKTYRTRKSA